MQGRSIHARVERDAELTELEGGADDAALHQEVDLSVARERWVVVHLEQPRLERRVEQEVDASSSTDVLEVMATPEPVSVEGSGAASSSSSASSSKQKRIAELSEEE